MKYILEQYELYFCESMRWIINEEFMAVCKCMHIKRLSEIWGVTLRENNKGNEQDENRKNGSIKHLVKYVWDLCNGGEIPF
jgi:hypothetical protein